MKWLEPIGGVTADCSRAGQAAFVSQQASQVDSGCLIGRPGMVEARALPCEAEPRLRSTAVLSIPRLLTNEASQAFRLTCQAPLV